nr:DUF2851 family protein [uncultured Carboxylicivirga sp.]
MNEDFLHFIWQNKLFHPQNIKTKDGQKLEVIHPGIKNTDSGPDFFNAKIKLDNTLWAGNVEIHIDETDWFNHGHQNDDAYNNVVLHVVNKFGKTTFTQSGREVPAWEMILSDQLMENYQKLFFNSRWIACEDNLSSLEPTILSQWLDRILIERLEEKSELILQLLSTFKNDWDQIFFILLSRSFGFGINGLPFEMMAKQTPLKILLKHSDNITQIEALLFGQAGFLYLSKSEDDYTKILKKEYDFLSSKYQLKATEPHIWKFAKLRPSNFPTVRLAQLAKLIYQLKGSFETLISNVESKSFIKLLNIQASGYWNNHYQLGKTSEQEKVKHLGKTSAQRILYNTIYPYLFVYFDKNNYQQKKENLLELLYKQRPEKNSILSNWEKRGIEIDNEAQAQALIFLKNHYCNHKKCLNCRIGHKVLSKR